MKKLLWASILVLPMISTGYAQQEMSASGQVVSVRLLTRTMTVRDTTANEVIRYNVPTGTPVTLAGQPGRFGYLRNGDMVNVTYVGTNDGREAVRIGIPQPTSSMDMRVSEGLLSTVTGRVENVGTVSRTLTVRGDQSGERFTYAVPEGVRFTIGGQNARLGLLQVGDDVVLRFTEEGGQRQAARVRVPQPVTPLAQRQPAPAGAVAQTAPRTQLPRTASSLPLLGLFGLLSLLAAVSLRVFRGKAHG
ncbi:MAG: hypothetical protein OEQ25_16740 [Gammaproteobacteria bacterium]|nr:hypothetical protein [Gammaproteobacteria bacterium]MDH3508786.1 hypothetical protein [Gammaproteobacteria bacterium]